MNKNLILLISCIIILFTSYKFTSAAYEKGFLGNARYISMSGAYAGLSDDESAVFVNPAGLIKLKTPGAGITLGDMYAGLDYGSFYRGNLCGGMEINKIGTIGIGIDHFMVGVDDNVSYTETLLVLSYARRLLPNTGFGVNIKVPRWASNLEGDTSYGSKDFVTSFDIGVIILEEKNLSIGGVLYDINQPSLQAKGGNGTLYYAGKFGVSYSTLKKFLIVDLDVAYNKNYIDLLLGGELSFKDLVKSEKLKSLTVRGGAYLHEFTEGFDFSLGVGYLVALGNHGLQIDYAFKYPLSSVSGTFGTHYITTSFRMDIAKRSAQTMNDFNSKEKEEDKAEEGMEEAEPEESEEGMDSTDEEE